MANFHRALIAGTHSGVGKTTWSLALMAYFRKTGFQIQPFKIGPDYIDPTFHHLVCAPRKSRNLDRYFLSREYIQRAYAKHSHGADLVLMEGVMGLYDGRTPLSEEGSTAEIAKILSVPVFLVIDGSGLARSAAAIVKGYRTFDLRVNLAGVFINRVGSEGHFQLLQKAIEKEAGVPVLGWFPEDASISIPERHLGLRTALEEEWLESKMLRLIQLLENHFDSKRFLQLSRAVRTYVSVKPTPSPSTLSPGRGRGKGEGVCRIGVAYDKAFSFYYEDNFDLLRQAGAELVFFSPLSDAAIPKNVDALYFGGGFPELYAEALSKNEPMRVSIRKFHHEGGMIYGECGGLIYMTQFFVDSEERKFPLVGLVPGRVRMTERLQNFGYQEIEAGISTFLFPHAKKLRSHEFHYSTWEVVSKNFQAPYRMTDRTDGFYDGRLLVSYQHLHFGQDPELARAFVRAAQASRKRPLETEKAVPVKATA